MKADSSETQGAVTSDADATCAPILCVDLDGTLIRSDLLWESLFLLISQQPLSVLKMPFWLLRGRAALKDQIAERVSIDVKRLPYREELLAWLRSKRQAGRRLVLATAANRRFAAGIADHLRLFDDVLASDPSVNCRGHAKLAAIRQICGPEGFDYVGDSRADLPVWAEARTSYAVGGRRLQKMAATVCRPEMLPTVKPQPFKAFLHLLRPHQWSKNLLVFATLVLSHATALSSWSLGLTAFICLCLAASATYVFNDLMDLASDRRHPIKRQRPLARGDLSIPQAVVGAGVLLALAFGLALFALPWLPVLLAGYLIVAQIYSLWLKRKVFLDVLCLASLYTYRVFVGGLVAGILISNWLIAFAIFLFLSLALTKRYVELSTGNGDGRPNARRGYQVSDLALIGQLGPNCGYLAVLVFLLYIAEGASGEYRFPQLLWLISPLLLYWITRIWFLAHRRQLHEDPVVFALRDRVSYVVGLCCAALMLLAA
jgi:4-hydroxybenzoate polyprenyltransferase/phosphoserine phosphatase